MCGIATSIIQPAAKHSRDSAASERYFDDFAVGRTPWAAVSNQFGRFDAIGFVVTSRLVFEEFSALRMVVVDEHR